MFLFRLTLQHLKLGKKKKNNINILNILFAVSLQMSEVVAAKFCLDIII